MSNPAELARLPMPDPTVFDAARALAAVERIAAQPSRFRALTSGLSLEALGRRYREGGWNVAQIVHHVADSHLHSYLRCKYALCETDPVIHPYEENDWVLTPDCDPEAVDEALALLDALHRKWTRLFRGLDEAGWNRSFHHPGSGKDYRLFQQVEIYAWHGDRHLAQAAMALGRDVPE